MNPPAAPARRRLALLIALVVGLAGAQVGPGPAPAFADDGDAGEGDGASVAVVVAGRDGAPHAPAIQATVQVSMERALKRDPRLAVIDQDDRLAARARRVPKDAVAEPRRTCIASAVPGEQASEAERSRS